MYPNGARGRSCEQELACFRARYYDLKSMSVTALSPYREPVTAAAVAAVRHVSWNLTVTQECRSFNEPGPAYSMPTMPALANVEDVMVEHLRIISEEPTTQTSRGSRSRRLELARQAKELALAALAAAQKAEEDASASISDEDNSDNTAEAAQAIIMMYEVEEQGREKRRTERRGARRTEKRSRWGGNTDGISSISAIFDGQGAADQFSCPRDASASQTEFGRSLVLSDPC